MSFPQYPRHKESAVAWLGELPEHWELTPARRLFAQKRESAGPDDLQLSATQRFGVVPQELFMEREEQKVVLALSGTEKFKHVERNDFVISLRSFQGGIEHSAYVGCVSPAYTVLRARRAICASFWMYLFKSSGFISELQSVTAGIRDGRSISYDQFSQLSLPLPPLCEQQVIAAFLDHETVKIGELIAENQRLVQLLKEKRQAVVSRAVTKGLHSAPPKDSGVPHLGCVPQHWNVLPLMRLTPDDRQIMYGIVLPGPHVEDGVPIVKGGDVKAHRLNVDTLSRTTREIEAGYVRSRLRGGDIVYSIRGSIGEAAMVPHSLAGANLTQDAARVAPRRDIHGPWLLCALQADEVFRQLDEQVTGATIRGINIRALKRAMIPTPPLSEQKAIAEFVNKESVKFDELVSQAERAVVLLQERRAALISAAVTGKIDVRGLADAEAA